MEDGAIVVRQEIPVSRRRNLELAVNVSTKPIGATSIRTVDDIAVDVRRDQIDLFPRSACAGSRIEHGTAEWDGLCAGGRGIEEPIPFGYLYRHGLVRTDRKSVV